MKAILIAAVMLAPSLAFADGYGYQTDNAPPDGYSGFQYQAPPDWSAPPQLSPFGPLYDNN